jgi:hypothetical protein
MCPSVCFLTNSSSHAIFKFGPRRTVSLQHMQVQQISRLALDVPGTYGSFPISNNSDYVIPQEEGDAKYAYTETGLLLRRWHV